MKPVVAIVGRANVGKSTLFNRLVGEPVAVVEDLPGTTRDRVFADVSWQGKEMTLVDTGGLDLKPASSMARKVKAQAEAAIAEADIIIFVLDVRDGLITTDCEIADLLRICHKPVVAVANKADNDKLESQINDFFQLGIGAPLAVSALHNRGITEIWQAIAPLLPDVLDVLEDSDTLKLAIVGRPNVGKSMLLNAIVSEDRTIVDQTPGTTRDAVDTVFNFRGQKLLIIDTAGIRRRGRASVGVEYYSLIRALRAINRCDVALLVTDATEFITAQDAHVAGYIKQSGKGIILIINKCDLVSEQPKEVYFEQIQRRLKFMSHVPVLFISAKFKRGIDDIIPRALEVWQERRKQLPDPVVDKFIKQAVMSHTRPRKGLKQLEVVRAYQTGTSPPSFALLVNDPQLVHFSYQRYLENKLRQTFGYAGTPVRILFRKAPSKKLQKAG
jgi:GTP-binding protein